MQQQTSTVNQLSCPKITTLTYRWLVDSGYITVEYLQQYGMLSESDGAKVYNELSYLYTMLTKNSSGIRLGLYSVDNDQSTSNHQLHVNTSYMKLDQMNNILQRVLSLRIYYQQLELAASYQPTASLVQESQALMLTNLLSIQRLLLGWIPTEQDGSLRITLGKVLVCSQTLGTYLLNLTQKDSVMTQ